MLQGQFSFGIAVRALTRVICGVLLLALPEAATAAPLNRDAGQARLEVQRSIDRVAQANLALAAGMTKLSQSAADVSKRLGSSGGAASLTPDSVQAYLQSRISGIDQQLKGQFQKQTNTDASGELAMISLQSLMSQRQQAVQLMTQMLQTLADTVQTILKNIDGGGGKPCKTCAALAGELSSSDPRGKQRAVDDATSKLKAAALEQMSRAGMLTGALDPKTANAMSANALVALIVEADTKAKVTGLQDSFTKMRMAQSDSYRASLSAVVWALQATIAVGHPVTGTAGATRYQYQTLDGLKKDLQILIGQIEALEEQIIAINERLATTDDQLKQAEKECIAAIQNWVNALMAAANSGGGAVAGAVAGFLVGGPIGAVVGAVAGAAGAESAAAEAEQALVIEFCTLLEELLKQQADLSKQLSDINAKIAKLQQEANSIKQQISKALQDLETKQTTRTNAPPRANLAKGSGGASKGTVVRSSSSSSATGVVATSKGGRSPCGSTANPCNQPRNRLMSPSLLDGGGGGFGTQGPAATGSPAAPMAPNTTFNRIR